jgi:HlyD family secretion protein
MATEEEKPDLSSLKIKRDNDANLGSGGTRARKSIAVYLSLGVVALVIVSFFIFSGGMSSAETVDVGTATLTSPGQANAILTASGYVVAETKAAVASKGTGRLEYLAVEEGDRVQKGNIIGRLESSDVEAALGQAKAALDVAKAGVTEAEAELDDATSNYQREKALVEQKLISDADFSSANARYRKAIAGVASAKASVVQAQAGVTAADVNVENTYIRAPFDGVVLTKDADVGDVITPFGAASGSKGDIVTMADMNSLEVEADVSESNIEKVYENQPCEITLDAVPDKTYRGVVHKIVPTADRTKATVMTKVKFLNKDQRVLPEMSAKVLFLNKPTAQTTGAMVPIVSVPISAITTREGKKVVFVINGETVSEVPVELGDMLGNSVAVKQGLSDGDKVVLHPSDKLSSGSKINIPK